MNVLWPNGSRTAPQLGGGFGPREPFWTPGGWTNSFHYGQDMTGFTDICAIADGVVDFAAYNGGFGNFLRIDHGAGIKSGSAHIAPGGFYVPRGARVRAGQPVARMGTTGRSTGEHLHLEIYRNGTAIDPAAFIRANLANPSGSGSGSANPIQEDDMPSEEWLKELGSDIIAQTAEKVLAALRPNVDDVQNRVRGPLDRPFDVLQSIEGAALESRLRIRGPLDQPYDMLQSIDGQLRMLVSASTPEDFDAEAAFEALGARLTAAFKGEFEAFSVAIRAEILASLGEVRVEGVDPAVLDAAVAGAVDRGLHRIGVTLTVAPAVRQ